MKVVYWSSTERMAEMLAEEIKNAGGSAEVSEVSGVSPTDLEGETVFALGASAMGDEELDEGEMEPFVEELEKSVSGKKIALFGSYDWGDGEWMRKWEERMKEAGAEVVGTVIANNEPAEPGADVETWFVGDTLYWKSLTEKGETLTAFVKEALADSFMEADAAGEKAVAEEQAAIRAIIEKLPLSHLDLSRFKPENTMELFDSPIWEELYKPCLACGTCTFVCPTCQCYDIRDFDGGKAGIQHYRCWDSCMYSDFTMMAHGNMRTSQLQRFRQRFMHKLVYYPANNDGMYSCVGCGRCVSKCPSSLNIVKVIKKLGGEGNE